MIHHVGVGQLGDDQQWPGRPPPARGQAGPGQVVPDEVLLTVGGQQRAVPAGLGFPGHQAAAVGRHYTIFTCADVEPGPERGKFQPA